MKYEIDNIYCADSVKALAELPDDYVDLTVTSPPYDNLRDYTAKFSALTFDWRGIIKQLYRVTKPGGVVVWVVADATIKGSETGTSFRQALYAMDCGFNLHDTMIYQQAGTGAKGSNYAYWQAFEYMFVFSKGMPGAVNRIADVKNTGSGKVRGLGKKDKLGNRTERSNIVMKELSVRPNVWRMASSGSEVTDHPAPFPEQLAHDHIISWSNPGDLVLDPFVGSGTVPKMAQETGRHFLGFDLSEEYCTIARNRVQTARIPLFTI